ncbi:Wzz/FepE/Etk N-terminal domain-containing protein [Paucibacter sp. R3-3]|uniref:Wzz/FepE/Etk N-terminal domain-containing protein n=1 Tax=Roseateles agri TaxID=3098619 RepID=A0ABU5DG55_9BURK|nr:Wzz/FepE/Etk N-terminal domain-containing protein [Paucibacter sp. R3-3]MDY0744254.1 Wzz/FepE/Etk N-terminal domain-containing protein [Paucibacter sp. R3-3]
MQQDHQMLASPQASPLNEFGLDVIVGQLWKHKLKLCFGALLIGAAAFGLSFLLAPQYTARTAFIPPQSSGGTLNAALSALGPLAGLAGSSGPSSVSGETFVSLLKSETIADRLIERFKLKELYKAKFQFETRGILMNRTRITFGKRDGIINLEVDDADPKRAADIANQYVTELKIFSASMNLTDAQRRRAFFEQQMKQTHDRLIAAEQALQTSGFDPGAIRAEPKTAAEEYGRTKAQLTTLEVQLQVMRTRLTDTAPEVRQLASTAAVLREQLQAMELRTNTSQNANYLNKYREYKYQEALYEQLSKQYEAARLDESHDNTAIQIIDIAQVPEWKSKPKRAIIGVVATLVAFLLLSVVTITRHIRTSLTESAAT